MFFSLRSETFCQTPALPHPSRGLQSSCWGPLNEVKFSCQGPQNGVKFGCREPQFFFHFSGTQKQGKISILKI